jgi:membrane protease YdiL (CAAX protease family)
MFTILLAAGLLGVLAILPFAMDLVARMDVPRPPGPELSMPMIAAMALVQNGVLLAVVIAIGLFASERVGLRMPLVRARAGAERGPSLRSVLVPGLLLGGAAGAAMVATDAIFFLRHLPPTMLSLFEIALWKRLLAGVLYGGITEELLMRLFLVSLLAWLLGKWLRTPAGMPSATAFRAAIALAAILFGLGHLPMTAAIAPLSEVLVTRALVLNGIAGVAFGYLYWRHGLEAAIAGHMGAHLVLQVPGFMLLRNLL